MRRDNMLGGYEKYRAPGYYYSVLTKHREYKHLLHGAQGTSLAWHCTGIYGILGVLSPVHRQNRNYHPCRPFRKIEVHGNECRSVRRTEDVSQPSLYEMYQCDTWSVEGLILRQFRMPRG